MNKMKRIFSFVLVLSMVLGTLASLAPVNAYAATVNEDEVTKVLNKVPADVIGTPHEKAIRRLIAFGIVGGYPDGTYKPEEQVTRAQFSKIIVEALGLGDAVPAAQNNKTGFPDVDAYIHWASGYINVANGQGLIKGYEDGMFRPEQPVTYAEALTMLVRALGYEDKFLKGNWPGNYVAKAADVGITRGVNIPSDAKTGANRGYVADLVNNTLDAKIVRAKTYNVGQTIVEYEATDITLLKEKLEISKHEDTRIFADKIVNDGLRKDEVSVRFLEDTKNKEEVRKTYRQNETADFRLDRNINVRPFIGEEVVIYLTKDDRVAYVERANNDKARFDAITKVDGEKIELYDFDKEYAFDRDADVYVFNGKDDRYDLYTGNELDKKELEDLGLRSRLGKFVVKNNKIVYAEIMDSTEAQPWFLALKNDKGNLEGVNKETEDFKLDLRKDGTYDYVLAFDTEGNEVKVEDIEKGNLLYVQAQSYDGDDIAVVTVVTNNKAEGELGKFREDRVEIDGKFLKAIKNGDQFDTYYTIDTLEDIEVWNNTDWENDFDDAYKEKVTIFKDAVGRIAFLTTEVETKSGYKFGVVTRTYADSDRVRIFTTIDGKEGKDIVFKAEKERDLSNAKVLDLDGKVLDKKTDKILGQAVKFRLNKDNEIVDGEFFVMDNKAVYTMAADFGKDTMRLIRVEGLKDDVNKGEINNERESFAVKDSATVIDAEGLNTLKDVAKYQGDVEVEFGVDVDDFNVSEWKNIKSTKKDQDLRFYVFPNKSRDAEGIVFVGKLGANTASDKQAVYVRDRWRKGDDIVIEYMAYGANETKEVIVDSVMVDGKVESTSAKILDHVKRRAPYVLEERSNGKVRLYATNSDISDDDFFEFKSGVVTRVSGNTLEIDNKDYTISNSTVVYDGGDKKSISNIRRNDKIQIIVEDKVRVRVVKLDGKVEDDKVDDKGIVTHINLDGSRIEVDGEIHKIDEDTRLIENKKTIAIGNKEIAKELNEGDRVKVRKGEIEIVERAEEIEALAKAEKALAKLEKAEKVTEADKEEVQKLIDKVEDKDAREKLQKRLDEIKVTEEKPEEKTIEGKVELGVAGPTVVIPGISEEELEKVILEGKELNKDDFDYGFIDGELVIAVEENSDLTTLKLVVSGTNYKVVIK